MIKSMLNLECEDGHKHYSPEPEKFVGKHCFSALGSGSTQRCQKRLHRIRPRGEK